MRGSWSLILVLMVPLVGRAEEKPKEKPRIDLPIKAKLVAKKTTYTLDVGGLTAAEYKKLLSEETNLGKLPPAPAVEMALELTNTSDKEVQFWGSGTPVKVLLDLKGPGAVSITPRQAFPRIYILPKPITLAPGKSHSIPIASLIYGYRGVAQRAYWTSPGDYTLSASLVTAISPAPNGTQPNKDGFAPVTITSEPIKIKVEGK